MATAGERGLAAERRFPMNSWSQTTSLLVVMAVIAVFYVLGRLIAEGL